LNKKLYVGNLNYSVSEDELGQFFTEAGTVVKAEIILDRNTGRSRGFGFVEMESEEQAKKAIELLYDKELKGRRALVREARPARNSPNPSGSLRRNSPIENLVGEPKEKSDFIKSIEKFVKEAIENESIGFKSDGKHFTIKRDEEPII